MEDWRKDLADFFQKKEERELSDEVAIVQRQAEAKQYFHSVVRPALEELKAELERYGREVRVNVADDYAAIRVMRDSYEEFHYRVRSRISPRSFTVYPETHFREGGKRSRAEGYFLSGRQDYGASKITRDIIIQRFLNDYKTQIARARK